MSRCFPFPPPGYEAKPRNEHEHKDLLKKEKHKDKKHKKERKERRRRERREKSSDRRKDKQIKKHSREKNKDKIKDKDGDRYKNKSLEKEIQKKTCLDNGRPEEKVQNEVTKGIKPRLELITRTIDQEDHANHIGSSTSKLLPRSTKSFGSPGSKEKKRSLSSVIEKSRRATHINHGIVEQSYNVACDNEKWKNANLGSKTRLQNGKSLQVESVEKHANRKHSHNTVELTQRSAEVTSTITTIVSGAERAPNDVTIPSPNSLQRTEQVDQHAVLYSHFPYRNSDTISPRGLVKIKNGSNNDFHITTNQQLLQSKDKGVKGKGKTKKLKANDHRYIEDKDRDQVVMKRKAKDKIKERGKVGKVDVNKQEHKELDSFRASKDKIDGLLQSGQLNEKFISNDVKKRKDVDPNTSLLVAEHGMRMNKLPRISPTIPCASDEILEHSHGSRPSSSTVPVGANTSEADRFQDSKECCNNDVTGSHHLKEPKTSISSSNCGSSPVSLKPPHPDAMYLNQVYSIPAMDDFSECIDQDWLLSRCSVDRKSEILEAAQPSQVWAEARLIDSADVVALPYIVPL
ncbi:glutamic acid-rich protein-like [Oryza brachyantha]|uniref:Uncharacterized protein n=1 Tax=Oryza brachyantha TaxID=4533 RepID=J3MUL4_ORYBR|nr:glutamic acid-rich protein-like [Oryza brachyantha]XP_015696217.1 glutamic acid-rich protein-like [Oryza brachyantha]